jgi:hypothetical protein
MKTGGRDMFLPAGQNHLVYEVAARKLLASAGNTGCGIDV